MDVVLNPDPKCISRVTSIFRPLWDRHHEQTMHNCQCVPFVEYPIIDELKRKMKQMITHHFVAWGLIVLVCILHLGRTITVDMTGQNLESVPQTIEPEVTNLVLHGNPLVTLHAGSFNTFLELLKLNVDYCEIEVINDGTFAMQVKLKTISMKYNSIRSLPLDFGPPVKSLSSLTIFNAFHRYYDLKPYYFSAFKNWSTWGWETPVSYPGGLICLITWPRYILQRDRQQFSQIFQT